MKTHANHVSSSIIVFSHSVFLLAHLGLTPDFIGGSFLRLSPGYWTALTGCHRMSHFFARNTLIIRVLGICEMGSIPVTRLQYRPNLKTA